MDTHFPNGSSLTVPADKNLGSSQAVHAPLDKHELSALAQFLEQTVVVVGATVGDKVDGNGVGEGVGEGVG